MVIAIWCLIAVIVGFALYMITVTASFGTDHLKVAQFLMSSLTYSKEATKKINLLLDKTEAEILTAALEEKYIVFRNSSTGEHDGSIWVGNKYYAYGILARYGSLGGNDWASNRPDIATFKRLVQLENVLRGTHDSTPETKQEDRATEVVLD